MIPYLPLCHFWQTPSQFQSFCKNLHILQSRQSLPPLNSGTFLKSVWGKGSTQSLASTSVSDRRRELWNQGPWKTSGMEFTICWSQHLCFSAGEETELLSFKAGRNLSDHWAKPLVIGEETKPANLVDFLSQGYRVGQGNKCQAFRLLSHMEVFLPSSVLSLWSLFSFLHPCRLPQDLRG